MRLFGSEFLYNEENYFIEEEKQKALEFISIHDRLSNCLLLSSAKPIVVNKKEVEGMLFVFISTIFQESSFLLS